MTWNKKTYAVISLIICSILLLSSFPSVISESLSQTDPESFSDFEPEIEEEVSPRLPIYYIDFKVKKQNEGEEEWSNSVDAYVGDTISFRIFVKNTYHYDLSKIQIEDTLSSADVLTYITGSSNINSEFIEPIIQNSVDGKSLVWTVDEFIAGKELVIIFNMLANSETEVEGLSNFITVTGQIDSKYKYDLIFKRDKLVNLNNEYAQIIEDIAREKELLDALVKDVDLLVLKETQLSGDIKLLSDNIASKGLEKDQTKLLIGKYTTDLEALNLERLEKEDELKVIQDDLLLKENEYKIKVDYISQLQADLNLEKELILGLQKDLDLALADSLVNDDKINNLLLKISSQEILIKDQEELIVSTGVEISGIKDKIDELTAKEALLKITIDELYTQRTQLSLTLDSLDLKLNNYKAEIEKLESEKLLKIKEKDDNLAKIAEYQAIEQELKEDIDSLDQIEIIVASEIVGLEDKIYDATQKLNNYEFLLAEVEEKIIALDLAISAKIKENELVVKDLQDKEIKSQGIVDDITFKNAVLVGQEDVLALLEATLSEEYKESGQTDLKIAGILHQISDQEAIIIELKDSVSTEEANLALINEDVFQLRNQDGIIAGEIEELEIKLVDCIQAANELNVQINNLHELLVELNDDLLIYKTKYQELSSDIYTTNLEITNLDGEIEGLKNTENALKLSINEYNEDIDFYTLEKTNNEAKYQDIILEGDSLNAEYSQKIDAQQLILAQIATSEVKQLELKNAIENRNVILGQDRLILEDYELTLKQAYEDSYGTDATITAILVDIDAQKLLIAESEAAIAALEAEKKIVDDDLVYLTDLKTKIEHDIDLSLLQKNSKIVELDAIITTSDNYDTTINLKEAEKTGVDSELLAVGEEIVALKEALAAKEDEFSIYKTSITEKQKLLQVEVDYSIKLTDQKASEEQALTLYHQDLKVAQEAAIYDDSEIKLLQDKIEAKEFTILQITRDIEDSYYKMESLIIDIQGDTSSMDLVKSGIDSLSLQIDDKEGKETYLLSAQESLSAEIAQAELDKANNDLLIEAKQVEIDGLSSYIAGKEVELQDTILLIEQRETNSLEIAASIIDKKSILELQRSSLEDYNLALTKAYEESAGTDVSIAELIAKIEKQKAIIVEGEAAIAALKIEKLIVDEEIEKFVADEAIIAGDIVKLERDIPLNLQLKEEYELKIADTTILFDAAISGKTTSEAELLYTQNLRAEKEEFVSNLRVELGVLQYEEGLTKAKIEETESIISQKNLQKEGKETDYQDILLKINSLNQEIPIRIEAHKALLAQIADKELLVFESTNKISEYNDRLTFEKDNLDLLRIDLDKAYEDLYGADATIGGLLAKIEAQKLLIAESETAIATLEAEKLIVDEDISYLTTYGEELSATILSLEEQKIQKTLVKNDYVLKIDGLNNDLAILSVDRDLKIAEDDSLKLQIADKEKALSDTEDKLSVLYEKDLLLDGEILSLGEDIIYNQDQMTGVEVDISTTVSQYNLVNDDYEKKLADQQLVLSEISSKKDILILKETYVIELSDLLAFEKQKLIALNDELDSTYLIIAEDNVYIQGLLDQIDDKQLVVDGLSLEVESEQLIANGFSSDINLLKLKEIDLEVFIGEIDTNFLTLKDEQEIAETTLQQIILEIDADNQLLAEKKLLLTDIGEEKTVKLLEVDNAILRIEDYEFKRYEADREIRILDKDIIKLDEDIIYVENNNYMISSVVNIYIKINPDELKPLIDVVKIVWDDSIKEWSRDIEINVGDTILFNISAKNIGKYSIQNIDFRDILPSKILHFNSNINYVSIEPDLISENVLIWQITSLDPGETFFVEYEATAFGDGVDINIANASISSVLLDEEKVEIVVNGISNNPPVAINDSFSTDINTPADFDVIINDYDDDSDEITLYEIVINPNNGTATIVSNMINYVPDTDFVGLNELQYRIIDGNGGADTAFLLIDVIDPDNLPPTANNDFYIIDEDTIDNYFNVLDNDTDPDVGDVLSLDVINTPPSQGVAHIDGNQIVYTPNSDFVGSDSLTYRISDSYGIIDTANVYITVKNINDAPIAINDTYTVQENTISSFDVIKNDYDIDGDVLNINCIVTQPNNGTANIESNMINYETETGFYGTNTIVYKIDDGNGENDTATMTINIIQLYLNNPPVAEDDIVTTEKNTSITIDILDNDYDPDEPDGAIIDPSTVHIISQPLNGTLQVDGETGIVTYIPESDFIGTNNFTYYVNDKDGSSSNIATVTINVKLTPLSLIIKPEKGYLYFRNGEPFYIGGFIDFFECDAIIIGPITIDVDVNNSDFNPEKVEFYIDDEYVGNSTTNPFNFTLNKLIFRICTLKVIAYDKDKTISNQIEVLILNLGLFDNADEE